MDLVLRLPHPKACSMAVVDGGTDAKVMGLMGRARNEARADFPLIEVARASVVTLPHQSLQGARTLEVEPHHTHFLLVPGSRWGDEAVFPRTVTRYRPSGVAAEKICSISVSISARSKI